ncbi:tRNA (adenosine(37)-N6)-threonylcarbamoyltransferase complex ATPase subunit type 1 TsaE [Tenacibaculum finnmarkense genomovar ulcerans]|uniref:tRNA (adenosine(37)-N6)-threonylcarbamoyltransferase complex ATPase subunit type 1 TsaE n=1 Tax=Tenacibaculum finnmarkense TaxID=2781243 RepID=UPI001E5ACFAB|nr:tRNA (adenosine(37)-N6)-threonylcarbamoyltransferase complex ATPase subunit type 1 TsaE [Tenacibaculum finnmarkense]MCD8432289.1 tRNA (adenosine(37)-N6)-threonylcarbamoyltransferase complex ATPase subunit type 1 TsaE [Tenacibaculum finnmarkense genomovar ulcerans]MCG8749021.1 tRNA (adenosine(37)-N6)-threonylcarbamoyltransferase complex ATPase subunit type 1 TsaE [Tenacibaculum finnmarkense]MCG8754078.1 tRNA (adenosine(37)-N6)-threonylcarbamoyltransferase complex ATPase subunit type 1 TsaE [Te
MNKNYSLNELAQIAEEIIKNTPHKVLLFHGDMGVGKTTLIKEICEKLGVDDVAHSPTFSLVNQYQTKNNDTVYHFDFYRIEQEEEAYDMGIEEYLYSNDWCLIEWPENVKNLLPLDAVAINITLLENGQRNIQLKTNKL